MDNATQCQIDPRNGHRLCQTQCQLAGDSSTTSFILAPAKDNVVTLWSYFEKFDGAAASTGSSVVAQKLERHVDVVYGGVVGVLGVRAKFSSQENKCIRLFVHY